jgi:hypothetical protein
VSGATVASIPALHLAGLLQYWQIVVLVFILTSVNSQGDAARLALVPALARLAHMPFERVNARDRAIARLGAVLGRFIAGVLIAEIGAVNVLFVDAGTFSISALLVAAGVPRSVDARERRPVEGDRRRYFAELADGLRFVRSKTFLLWMILVATVGNFFDQPLLTVVAPVYAKDIYGSPATFGALVGSFGAGAFAGALLFGSVGRRWPRRRTFLTCYLVGAGIIYGTSRSRLRWLSPSSPRSLRDSRSGPSTRSSRRSRRRTRRRTCWDASSGRSPRSHRRRSLSEPWLWVSRCSERG